MHRFYVGPEPVTGSRLTLPPDAARQASSVLRLRPGETVAVFDGTGAELEVRLDRVSASETSGEVIESRHPPVEPRVAVTVCQAVLKADRFEFVLQRCTEAGAARFQPLIAARCVAAMPGGSKLRRWERIVREAAEQSGRLVVPRILPPIAIADLPRHPDLLPAVCLWEDERGLALRDALDRLSGEAASSPGSPTRLDRLSLVIGPEGGLEKSEVDSLASAGIAVVSIGPRVLRAETAALAAVVAALFQLGEMERNPAHRR